MENEEIIKDGYETFSMFMNQLEGENDLYKQILLEEVIKFIYKEYYNIEVN